jgi:hypothetical protein
MEKLTVTVAELIQELEALPKDSEVFLEGYSNDIQYVHAIYEDTDGVYIRGYIIL